MKKIPDIDKPILLYVPGFLSETGSQLTPTLKKWCRANNRQLVSLAWESCVMEDILTNGIITHSYDLWHKANKNTCSASKKLKDFVKQAKTPIKLLGFSLGCKVIVESLSEISTDKIQQIILFGAAIPHDFDLNDVWQDKVINFHSNNDLVLKVIYRIAEKCDAAGLIGLKKAKTNIEHPFGHLEYRRVLEKIKS